MLLALSPPEKLGEFFGLFSLASKFSAVFGPALTATMLVVLGGLEATAYRISIGSLAVIMALGIVLLARPRLPPGSYRGRVRAGGARQGRG